MGDVIMLNGVGYMPKTQNYKAIKQRWNTLKQKYENLNSIYAEFQSASGSEIANKMIMNKFESSKSFLGS